MPIRSGSASLGISTWEAGADAVRAGLGDSFLVDEFREVEGVFLLARRLFLARGGPGALCALALALL